MCCAWQLFMLETHSSLMIYFLFTVTPEEEKSEDTKGKWVSIYIHLHHKIITIRCYHAIKLIANQSQIFMIVSFSAD